ncbi:DoxX family protein [Brevibacterium sp. HMSC24B04]|uniref:DoxX family protein n=1 Tax=Brevibacterium sp. HMSC24B04 TaxID=1581060 RepID=UPI0008A3D072|nr:DoxX family protein [Brevibacterium sp. HMSC24B04]OFT94167.1 DoxX family protein [Brevibacterium sp. HMSC24B04]
MFNALARTAGRLAIAPLFVVNGLAAAKAPGPRPQMAASTLETMREYVPAIPNDDELVVRINGGIQAAAGLTLGLGLFPKASAAVLAGSLIPTTLAGHAFWKEEDEGQKAAHKTQFYKNAAIVGGLLAVVGAKK